MDWRPGDGVAGVAVDVASATAEETVGKIEGVSVTNSPIGDGDSSRVSRVAPESWGPHATTDKRTDMKRIENVAWKNRSRNFRLTAISDALT